MAVYEPIPDNHAKVARERYRYEHVKRASKKKLFFNKLELWLTKCKLINEYQPYRRPRPVGLKIIMKV